MAQFDVYRGASMKGYLVDCQSNLLSILETRVVVPFVPMSDTPTASRLNPVISIEGERHIMSTQLLFAIPKSRLAIPLGNIAEERDKILNAIDVLWSGV
jgi:toxin CcdB